MMHILFIYLIGIFVIFVGCKVMHKIYEYQLGIIKLNKRIDVLESQIREVMVNEN